MTPAQVLADARYLLQDNDTAADFRQSDTELFDYLNEAVALIHAVRPELFRETGIMTCVAGPIQAIKHTDAQALHDVMSITGGPALTVFDVATLDTFDPTWRAAAGAAAEQWAPMPGDQMRFLVRPPALLGQELDVVYVKRPPTFADGNRNTDMDLPEWMRAALTSYVASRAETKDDEHVNSNRATMLAGQFRDAITAGAA